MAITVTGWGGFVMVNAVTGELSPIRANEFSVESESETEDIQAYPQGDPNVLQVLDTATLSTTYTLNLSTGSVQDITLDRIFDLRRASQTGSVVRIHQIVTVPATGPYTFTVTGLTEDQAVQATISTTAAPGDTYMEQIDAADVGTIAAGEVAVTANTLTFAAADAGKTVEVAYLTSKDIVAIGGDVAVSRFFDGNQEFLGKVKFKASNFVWNFWARNLLKTEGVSIGSGIDNLEEVYQLGAYTGWNVPFKIWRLAS